MVYYTILYYTILYYTIIYYTILYYTILYYTIPQYTILYYTILYYTIPYYTILYYTILYYHHLSKLSDQQYSPAKSIGSRILSLLLRYNEIPHLRGESEEWMKTKRQIKMEIETKRVNNRESERKREEET